MDFVLAGMRLPSIWDNLGGQIYLGKKAFVRKCRNKDKRITAAYQIGNYTMKIIADEHGVYYATAIVRN